MPDICYCQTIFPIKVGGIRIWDFVGHLGKKISKFRHLTNPFFPNFSRLEHLYGPLYGNRMLHAAGIKAVEDVEGMPIEQLLTKICKNKDRDGLDNWRGLGWHRSTY